MPLYCIAHYIIYMWKRVSIYFVAILCTSISRAVPAQRQYSSPSIDHHSPFTELTFNLNPNAQTMCRYSLVVKGQYSLPCSVRSSLVPPSPTEHCELLSLLRGSTREHLGCSERKRMAGFALPKQARTQEIVGQPLPWPHRSTCLRKPSSVVNKTPPVSYISTFLLGYSDLSVERIEEGKKLTALKRIKRSLVWISNFMQRIESQSSKGIVQEGLQDTNTTQMARTELQKCLFTFVLGDVCNSDEDAILCRSLPSRAIRNTTKLESYQRRKDVLTSVLTVSETATMLTF